MNEEYTPDLVELTYDEGNTYNFEVIDSIEDEGNHYVALTPCDKNGNPTDDDSLIIMKEVLEGEEIFYEEIEDDNEYETISDAFINRLEDYFEIKD